MLADHKADNGSRVSKNHNVVDIEFLELDETLVESKCLYSIIR